MLEERPEISVVILCYRAEDFVPVFVARVEQCLRERGLSSYELVLVANYHAGQESKDRTPGITHALAAENPRVVVVAKPKEGMMGWDMRSGLEAARGNIVAVIDGDGQMPPEDLVKLYDALIAGDYDMAKTYRVERHDPLSRLVVSRIFNLMLKMLFPAVRVRDTNSKPKMLRYEALHRLTLMADRWFIDAEIMIQASWQKFRIVEIPTVFYANQNRPSFITIKSILGFVGDMLVYRVRTLFREE